MKKILILFLFLATSAFAVDSYWTGGAGDGDLANSLNWDTGIPSLATNSYFTSSTNISLISSSVLSSSNLFFDATNSTTWRMSLSSPLSLIFLNISSSAWKTNTLSYTSGILTNSVFILGGGSNSIANFTQTGGEFYSTNQVYFGTNKQSTSTYLITGGTNFSRVFSAGWGSSCTGIFVQTGGYVTNSVSFRGGDVGGSWGGTGFVTISNGTFNAVSMTLDYGGLFNVVGGTNYLGSINLGGGNRGAWNILVNGGISKIAQYIGGDYGSGLFTQSNGLVYTTGSTSVKVRLGNNNRYDIINGTNIMGSLGIGTAPSTLTTGHVLLANGILTNQGAFLMGGYSHGRMTVSNGLYVQTGNVTMCTNAGINSIYAIAGGTNQLNATLVSAVVANSTGLIVMTGGNIWVTNATTMIASNGVANLTISNGNWYGKDMYVGAGNSGVGAVIVNGKNSSMTISNMYIGTNLVTVGTGNVTVSKGGTLNVNTLQL